MRTWGGDPPPLPVPPGRQLPPPGAGMPRASHSPSQTRPHSGWEGWQPGASQARSLVPGPHLRVAGRPGVETAADTGPVWPWGWPHPVGMSPASWGQRALKGHIRLGVWKACWEEAAATGPLRVPSLFTQSPIHRAHPPREGHLTTPASLAPGGSDHKVPLRRHGWAGAAGDQRVTLPGTRRGPASGICCCVGHREEALWGWPAPSPSPCLTALPRSSTDHPWEGRVSEPCSGPWQGLALGSREVAPGQHPPSKTGAPRPGAGGVEARHCLARLSV